MFNRREIFCAFAAFIGGSIVATIGLDKMSGAPDPNFEAGRIARAGLPVFAMCAVFFGANISVIGFCQSVEDALHTTVLTLLRGIVLLVPAFMLLPRLGHWWGVWASIPGSEAATLLIIIVMAIVIT